MYCMPFHYRFSDSYLILYILLIAQDVFIPVTLLLKPCACAVQSTTIVKDTNVTVYNAIKITLVIFVMEFDFHSLNDTVSGQ